jgi:hypothetical protein
MQFNLESEEIQLRKKKSFLNEVGKHKSDTHDPALKRGKSNFLMPGSLPFYP